MSEKILVIRPPLIDNFIRIIKNLAGKGRNNYQKFLIKPLSEWSPSRPVEPVEKLISLLENAEKSNKAKLPLLYKMTIIKSVAPDQLNMSIPGNISLNFLKTMKNDQDVKNSDEAIEFINLLREPFKVFSEHEFARMNKQFAKEIVNADTVEVEKIIHMRDTHTEEDKRVIALSEKSILEIKKMILNNQPREIKRAMTAYLLKFSSASSPDRHMEISKLIDIMNHRQNNFRKDLMDTTAIIIYHEILKAIKEKKIDRAVKFIGKFTVLFRGDPLTPNYVEVDSFEKKFFQIIDERNLWDHIKI